MQDFKKSCLPLILFVAVAQGLNRELAPYVFSTTILDLIPTSFALNRELFGLNRERTAAKSSFAI